MLSVIIVQSDMGGGGMMPSTLLSPNAKNTAEYTDNMSITTLQ